MANRQDLEALLDLVTKSLKTRIEQDLTDNVPTDAATLGAAIKLLKDNSCTADPANRDELDSLRDKLKEAANKRMQRASNVIALAGGDLEATGT